MSIAYLQEAARLAIQNALKLPEAVARHHVTLLADQTVLFADGAWTAATRTLAKAATFAATTTTTRTWLYLHDAGSGRVVPGWYRVVSRTSNDAVVLDREIRTRAAIAGAQAVIDAWCVRGALADMAGAYVTHPQDWKEEVRRLLPPLREPVWPDEDDVAAGTVYGPDGDNFLGTAV